MGTNFASQLHYTQKVYYEKYPFNLLFLYKLLHIRCGLRKYTQLLLFIVKATNFHCRI